MLDEDNEVSFFEKSFAQELLIVRRKKPAEELQTVAKKINIILDGFPVTMDEIFVQELVASGFFEIVGSKRLS